MCLLPIASALAFAAFMVGDGSIMALTLMLMGALVGTSFFSFQANLARLGHSGCTLLGYCAAMLAVALVLRNPALGWALPAVLFAHPLLEALAVHLHKALGAAQGPVGTAEAAAHWLAMLSPPHPQDRRRSGRRLSAATLSWVIATVSVAPALLWWNDGQALALCLAARVVLQALAAVVRPTLQR